MGKPLKMGDYMLYIFKGIEPVDKNVSADKKIELPVTYLAIVIMCAFIVGINVGDKDDYVVLCFQSQGECGLLVSFPVCILAEL